jgi:hypothetical protein
MTNEQLFKLIEGRLKKRFKVCDPKVVIDFSFKGKVARLGVTFKPSINAHQISTFPLVIATNTIQRQIQLVCFNYNWHNKIVYTYDLNKSQNAIPIREVKCVPEQFIHTLIYEVINAMKDPESYLKLGVFDVKPIFDKDESYEALSIEADLEHCI